MDLRLGQSRGEWGKFGVVHLLFSEEKGCRVSDTTLGGDGMETNGTFPSLADDFESKPAMGLASSHRGKCHKPMALRSHDLHEGEVFAFGDHPGFDVVFTKPVFQGSPKRGGFGREKGWSAMEGAGKVWFESKGELALGTKGGVGLPEEVTEGPEVHGTGDWLVSED
jgi:hypothetical protein